MVEYQTLLSKVDYKDYDIEGTGAADLHGIDPGHIGRLVEGREGNLLSRTFQTVALVGLVAGLLRHQKMLSSIF